MQDFVESHKKIYADDVSLFADIQNWIEIMDCFNKLWNSIWTKQVICLKEKNDMLSLLLHALQAYIPQKWVTLGNSH